MPIQGECHHEWVKHGDRQFYCGSCGFFIETLEELKGFLDSERNALLNEVEHITNEVNCQHCGAQLKSKLNDLRSKKKRSINS